MTRARDVANLIGSGGTMTGALTVDTATSANLTVDSGVYGGIQFKVAGTNTGYITSHTNGSGAEAMYIGGADTVNLHTGTNHALTGGTTRLQIDSSGRVTMPSQPSFMIRGSTGSKTLASGGAVASGMYNPTVLHNVGNHLNTSNAIFTAPLTGRYYMEWVAYTQTTGGLKNEYVATYLNFSNLGAIYGFHECGGDVCAQISGIFTMSANDTVQPYTYGQTNRTQTYLGQHSYFSGHLLG
jgi:hypothetical protein